MKTLCALYALCVGISMFIVWGGYFVTGSVFGIAPNPLGLGFHIAAELATGAVFLVAGIGMFAAGKWGFNAYFLGIGMLLYAVINSPGLYAGNKIMMAVFAGTFVFAVIFIVLGFIAAHKNN